MYLWFNFVYKAHCPILNYTPVIASNIADYISQHHTILPVLFT